MNRPRVGDRVRIERDETRWPSRGTWPRYRGRTGVVVEINLGEVGVAIGKQLPPSGKRGGNMRGDSVTWFMPWELKVVGRTDASERPLDGLNPLSRIDGTRELLNA